MTPGSSPKAKAAPEGAERLLGDVSGLTPVDLALLSVTGVTRCHSCLEELTSPWGDGNGTHTSLSSFPPSPLSTFKIHSRSTPSYHLHHHLEFQPASPLPGLLQIPLCRFPPPALASPAAGSPTISHHTIHSSALNPPVVPVTQRSQSSFPVLAPGFLTDLISPENCLAYSTPASSSMLSVRQTSCGSVVWGSTFPE